LFLPSFESAFKNLTKRIIKFLRRLKNDIHGFLNKKKKLESVERNGEAPTEILVIIILKQLDRELEISMRCYIIAQVILAF